MIIIRLFNLHLSARFYGTTRIPDGSKPCVGARTPRLQQLRLLLVVLNAWLAQNWRLFPVVQEPICNMRWCSTCRGCHHGAIGIKCDAIRTDFKHFSLGWRVSHKSTKHLLSLAWSDSSGVRREEEGAFTHAALAYRKIFAAANGTHVAAVCRPIWIDSLLIITWGINMIRWISDLTADKAFCIAAWRPGILPWIVRGGSLQFIWLCNT